MDSWNKYRSEMTIKTKKNSLDYMIDPTFWNSNRLFAFSFKNGNNDHKTDSFDTYYIPLIEIKDFHELLGNKPFSDQPVKEKKAHEKLVETSRKYDSTIGSLLNYLHHQNNLKSILFLKYSSTN